MLDTGAPLVKTQFMAQTVTPLPSIGDVVPGQDVAGRELRISGHPDADRVVLSIWQSGRCLATVRLARADIPEVTRALVAGLVPVPAPEVDGELPEVATVYQFRQSENYPLREVTARMLTKAVTTVTTRLPRGLRRPGPRD